MYFGALMVGVDLACGLLAMHHIRQVPERVSLIFKDVKAQFLKRAEGTVRFECLDGSEIQTLIQQSITNNERCSKGFEVKGYLDKTNECVVSFEITLSVK